MGKREGNGLEEVSATSACLPHAESLPSLSEGEDTTKCVTRSGCVKCPRWYERFPPICA